MDWGRRFVHKKSTTHLIKSYAAGGHFGQYNMMLKSLKNSNMTSLNGSQKPLRPCALDESSLSIGRIKLAF